jgi:hypothetical protein
MKIAMKKMKHFSFSEPKRREKEAKESFTFSYKVE